MVEPVIAIEAHKLTPDSYVEFLQIDLTPINPANGILYYTNTPIENAASIQWKGQSYQYFPYNFSGITNKADGTGIERAKLSVSNVNRVLITAILSFGSLIGGVVKRERTFYKFTDGQPQANPLAAFPLEDYIIIQKSKQNRLVIEYTLSSFLDMPNAYLPARQMLRDTTDPDNSFPGIAKTRLR